MKDEQYIKGAKDTLKHIRENLDGGALRKYDLVTYPIRQAIEFIETGKSNIFNKEK